MLIEERFHSKYIKGEEDDCWLWTDYLDKSGYGHFYIETASDGVRIRKLAHVFMWTLVNGEIIDPEVRILHSCDNGWCVNPKHLFEGTHLDNMRDMINKGRAVHKIKSHCPQGHPYDEENTYINPSTGWQQCRQCKRDRRLSPHSVGNTFKEID